MPFVNADGQVSSSRSWFRLSIISDIFWGITDFVSLFFTTLLDPNRPIPKRKLQGGSSTPSGVSMGGSGGVVRRGPNIRTLPKNCSTAGG